MLQGVVRKVTQQLAQGFGAMQGMARQELPDLRLIFPLVHHGGHLARDCNTKVNPYVR